MSKQNFSKLGFLASLCILICANSFAGVEKRPDTSINPNSKFDLKVFNGTYKLINQEGNSSKGCLLNSPSQKEETPTIEYTTNAYDPVGIYHPSFYIGGDQIFKSINQGPSVIDNGYNRIGVFEHLACLAFYMPAGSDHAHKACNERKEYNHTNKGKWPVKSLASSNTFSQIGADDSKIVYEESIEDFIPGEVQAQTQTAAKNQLIRSMQLSADGNTLKTTVLETSIVEGKQVSSLFKNCSYEKIK